MLLRGPLPAGAVAVLASGPAAGPALSFFEFLLGPADAAFPGRVLFGVEDPADELVAGQRREGFPRGERSGAGDQRSAQVGWHLVRDPARHALADHGTTVTSLHCFHRLVVVAGAGR